MKNQLKRLAVIACLSITVMAAKAQAPVPPPNGNMPPPPALMVPGNNVPPPPVLADATPGRRGRKGQQQGLQTLTTVSGKVTGYVVNDRNIYNAFTLLNGSQTVTVRFPDHMGEQLMADAKKGETISVNGFTDTNPQGVSEFHLVSAKVGSTQLTDTPPAPPTTLPAPEIKNYSGSIRDFRKDLQGNINGVILDNKDVIELPPLVTSQLLPVLKNGEKIEVTGFKVVPPTGVVMAQQTNSIRPQTITLNGQTYLVR